MTLQIEVDTSGVDELFRKTGGTGADVRRAVSRGALLLETRIKANASGRPGPNAPTGDYRRSWNTQLANTAEGAVATVGTNKPQARRLEFGFSGTDSRGRTYNQPPYAHVRPAIAETEEQIREMIIRAALGKK